MFNSDAFRIEPEMKKIWLSETCLWFCRQILQELYFGNIILFQWFDEQFVSMVWWAIMTHSTGSSSHSMVYTYPGCTSVYL